MRRPSLLAATLVLATGCAETADPVAATDAAVAAETQADAAIDTGPDVYVWPARKDVTFCKGAHKLLYAPDKGDLDAFPDDYFTIDDPTSATGLKVQLEPGKDVALVDAVVPFKRVFTALSTLDGFGTTAGQVLLVEAPIDSKTLPVSGDGSGHVGATLVLVDLDQPDDKKAFRDVQVRTVHEIDGQTGQMSLLVLPMQPLRPRTRYGLALTTRVLDTKGGCFAPSAAMQQVLANTATQPRLARAAQRVQPFIERLKAAKTIAHAGELTAAVVFTTQSTWHDSAVIAHAIRKGKNTWQPVPVAKPAVPDGNCVVVPGKYRACEGQFEADDFRIEGHHIDPELLKSHANYTLPVTVWLPLESTDTTQPAPPYPTVIFGHGLGGEREQAAQLAALACPKGYAVVAIDAVRHGQHPSNGGVKPAKLLGILTFFGISTNLDDPLDPLALRDNWRQSSYDKLQLVEMLRPGVDVDGKGANDVGIGQLVYLGVSLGGIMSAEFLAFSPEVQVAVPIVPGARVFDIVQDSVTFAPVIALMRGQATDGQVARFFPVMQTTIDRGDAGVYAQHVAQNRLPGFDQARPQVLMQMVLEDDTVPNSTNLFFARSLGLPHLGTELLKVGSVAHGIKLPAKGNLDATHSGGVFQFDVVWEGSGPKTKVATHGNVAANPVAIAQSLHFIETGLAGGKGGVAEVLDPYVVLGVKK